jgi:hypothetical protein
MYSFELANENCTVFYALLWSCTQLEMKLEKTNRKELKSILENTNGKKCEPKKQLSLLVGRHENRRAVVQDKSS